MNLTIKVRDLALVGKQFQNDQLLEWVGYRSPDSTMELPAEHFSQPELAHLFKLVAKSDEPGAKRLTRRIRSFISLSLSPERTVPAKLESLAIVLKAILAKTQHKWLFVEEPDGFLMPWFVHGIKYQPTQQHRHAYCSISLIAYRQRGQVMTHISFAKSNLGRKQTVSMLLASRKAYLESPELVKEHDRWLHQYETTTDKTGQQWIGSGLAYDRSTARTSMVPLEINSVPATVVLDDQHDEGREVDDKGPFCSTTLWDTHDDTEGTTVLLPTHPYLKVFSLRTHSFLEIHVENLEPYVYAENLVEKLVLPGDTKSLVNTIMQGTVERLDDIVAGKSSGLIIAATGNAGLGKTLTAEVFAEEVHKPLYRVQCVDLGTSAVAVEENLNCILTRAARWNAVVLLDEADVYVRKRGEDLEQNAIVGVFLRSIEYFRGILFLTSNRETIIDDAILSRVTAWLRYAPATGSDRLALWKVLASQFKVSLTEAEIRILIEKFPFLSGRSIKNLYGLGRMLAQAQNEKLGVETLEYASKFLWLETGSNDN